MAFARVNQFALLWRDLGLKVLLEPTPIPKPGMQRKWIQVPKPPVQKPAQPIRRNLPPRQLLPLLPKSKWPKQWIELLNKTKPGHVVWTYPELGCDLLKVETKDVALRRAFLARVLRDKPPYPQGTHTFWPYRLTENGNPGAASAPLFWTGVQALGARIVICLGQDACNNVLGAMFPPYSIRRIDPYQIMVVQEIKVIEAKPEFYTQLIMMLRSVLAKHHILPLAD